MEPHLLRTPLEARALLDPLRIRLLRQMEFPISASGLARRLHLPRQRVNYHLRELEKAGLVRLARERRVGNCTERLVQAVARRFALSPEILGGLSPEPATPPETTIRVRLELPTAEAREAFASELESEIRRLAAAHGVGADTPSTWVVTGIHSGSARRRLPDPRGGS